MKEEMESLSGNETWDLVTLLNGWKPISSKWVFKKKMNTIDQVKKYKDPPVAKGYSQVEGVKFDEILSPITKLSSIRILIPLVATFYLEIE